jgi:hypothetical protein
VRTLLVLLHFDWFGPAEELCEFDELFKKSCAETEGVKYKGRYTPRQKRYHWTYLAEAENLAKWEEAEAKLESPRDYNKLPHGEFEFFAGPYHE